MNLTQEKKKLILMIALLAVLGGVFYYNFSGSSADDPTPTKTGQPAKAKSPAKGAQDAATNKNELPVITQPLVLASMSSKTQEPTAGRNIFLYPTPTPPPPPVTPSPTPPPPITLTGVNPGGVIAQTAGFTMTVFGAKIPPDARAFIAWREHKTTFVSEAQLKVEVPATTIASPGSLPVEVRGASDPKMFSNVVNLNITPPPAPPYKYLGMIVKNGVTTAMVKFDLEEGLLPVRKDTVLGGHWKIINITIDNLEIEDTNIKVKHRVPFTGEGG